MANAAKLHDYSVAQSREEVSQVFDHLAKVMLPYWEERVVRAAQQVRIVAMRPVPPRDKDRPTS